jgi:DNA polymerase/3'-5' exonuclease PolX
MSPVPVPTRYQLAEAETIAAAIVEHLAPYCERIVEAGSIRRRAATIGDVEIVVIPAQRQQAPPLFPDEGIVPLLPPIDCLDEHLAGMLEHMEVRKRPDRSGRTFWGPSDKRLLWRYGAASTDWIGVDVFGASLETWGAKLVLRTGPWELSKRLVTPRAQGGLMPDDLQFTKGGLYRFDTQTNARFRTFVPTPDEETLFRELGLPYVAPEHRTPTTFRHNRWRP